MTSVPPPSLVSRVQQNIIAGILIAIPISVTWFAVVFLFNFLNTIGQPIATASIVFTEWIIDDLDPAIQEEILKIVLGFQSAVAILGVIVILFFLGFFAKQVIGRQILAAFEALIERIPVITTIYGAMKSLVNVLQKKPKDVQRVVLISFPNPEMKTVGFVTRTMKDKDTGKTLAAVYVPTTPNPTSGYLEIVPLEQIVATDWTMDEAMSFIISGGAVGPDAMNYDKSVESIESADDLEKEDV